MAGLWSAALGKVVGKDYKPVAPMRHKVTAFVRISEQEKGRRRSCDHLSRRNSLADAAVAPTTWGKIGVLGRVGVTVRAVSFLLLPVSPLARFILLVVPIGPEK